MSTTKLSAKKRGVLGRKVKKLREEGLIPANLYGKKVSSQALILEANEFDKVYSKTGETGIVDLQIEGEKEERPILIKNIQVHPVTEKVLHVDLRQIILTEKVNAQIPVELVGEAPAVNQKLGILIQVTSEIEVEALPADLPERLEADVSKLANVDDEILVKDLAISKAKVEVLTDENLVVAKIDRLAKEEEVPVSAEEVAEGVEETTGEEGTVSEPAEEKEENIPEKTE